MDLETLNSLAVLAESLHDRRQAILDTWRAVVLEDPELQTPSRISVLHFEDIAPQILDQYEQRLRAADDRPKKKSEEEKSFEHGAHRWQEGYSLREMVREWGHFQSCVLEEIEQLGHTWTGRPDLLRFARRLWLQVCTEGISSSVEEFDRLQKAEAEGLFQDLHRAMLDLKGMERERATLWHQAAHDLRGNVGLVTTTTSLLTEAGVPDGLGSRALSLLQTSVESLQKLLEDLLNLARLEAGREDLRLETFDTSTFLQNLCTTLEILAKDKGLYLKTDGPPSFVVEGDPAKLQRILQNLILNALKYTRSGGITIFWGPTRESDIERWLVRIVDTGPGMPAGPGGPLTAAAQQATVTAKKVEDSAASPDIEPVPDVPAAFQSASPGPQRPGEGIGLLIVKRLCEILHAGLEVSSRPGEGTVFQIVLPRNYRRPSPQG